MDGGPSSLLSELPEPASTLEGQTPTPRLCRQVLGFSQGHLPRKLTAAEPPYRHLLHKGVSWGAQAKSMCFH